MNGLSKGYGFVDLARGPRGQQEAEELLLKVIYLGIVFLMTFSTPIFTFSSSRVAICFRAMCFRTPSPIPILKLLA